MQFVMNPWRKGRAAAAEYLNAMAEWRAIAKETSDWKAPQPERPRNPYPLGRSKNSGSYKWQEGFESEMRALDRERRGGNRTFAGGRMM